MRTLGLVVTAVVATIMLACNGGDDGTPTSTASPAPTSASPTATPTVAPSASPEPAASASATPAPTASIGEGRRLGVARVRSNDPDGGLNLRSAPAGSEVLAVLPFNDTDLTATGNTSELDGATWIEVTAAGTTGWVSAGFVLPLPSFDDLSCGDTSTGYTAAGAVPLAASAVDASADHILAMHQYENGDCQRTVITFGRDFDFDRDLAGTLPPAAGVPENVAVVVDLASFGVRLPESVIAAATTATDSFQLADGRADLFFFRRATAEFGIAALFDSFQLADGRADLLFFRRATAEFGIAALFDSNRAARVTTLSDPGQLVIDTVDAPTGTGLDLAPLSGGLTVLRNPINVDVDGPPPEPPIVVSGFSRPFEASGVAVLRSAPLEGDPPGSGEPVTADWSGGVLGDGCAAQYGFMTTDYIEAWGAFEFTVEALAPGTYELFVGEFSAQDGSELGVYHVFTVGGSSAASC